MALEDVYAARSGSPRSTWRRYQEWCAPGSWTRTVRDGARGTRKELIHRLRKRRCELCEHDAMVTAIDVPARSLAVAMAGQEEARLAPSRMLAMLRACRIRGAKEGANSVRP